MNRYFALLLGVSCLLLGSCRVSKHVAADEALVTAATVELKTSEKVKNKRELRYQLEKYIEQKPNEKLLGTLGKVRLWAYYRTDEPSDTSRWDRWTRKTMAEPPSIYSTEKTISSAKSMENFLRKQGYWNAAVKIDTVKKFKKAEINYIVSPNERYYFEEVSFHSSDSSIQQILRENSENSFLEKDEPIDATLYRQEAGRVVKMLRDSGYFNFSSEYIDRLEIVKDSSTKVKAKFTVLPPPGGGVHLRYTVGDIRVLQSYNPANANAALYRREYKNVSFLSPLKRQKVKPKVLNEQIYISEGDRYSASQIEKTNQQLGQLELYRFISVTPKLDSSKPQVLDYDIYLMPRDKWSAGYELELNTTSTPISNSLIGGLANINLTNRNLMHGAEVLNTRAGFRIEFPSKLDELDQIITSLEAEVEASIQYPTFKAPLGVYSRLGRLKLGKKKLSQIFLENTLTRISVGYNYVLFRDFYEYSRFNGEFTYTASPTPRTLVSLTPTAIDYLDVNTFDRFERIQQRNPFLLRSFSEQQLFTGFLFRNLDYLWRTPTSSFGKSWRINTRFEISGWEGLAINGLVNALNGNDRDTLRLAGVPFSHYTIGELDVRHYKNVSPTKGWAYRAAIGAGIPFGFTSEVPYVKQFFVGGPTSLRAFQIREVGPGGFYDFAAVDSNLQFYQTGDFKLEFNIEYRFDLFWFFEAALFLDGGNVWTLQEDKDRIGSQLRWMWEPEKNEDGLIISDNFINQFALGAGLGLRMDLDYFILRLDLGYPIRNNYPNPNPDYFNSYWNVHKLEELKFNKINFNLAIGYPF